MSRSSTLLTTLTSALTFALPAALALAACKKTETTGATKTTEADPAAPSPAQPAAAPTAAAPAAPAALAAPAASPTKEYANSDPAFTIQVPADFEANEPMQTGPGNTSIRLAREGEHSGIGTFVSITWWEKDAGAYPQLLSQMTARAKTKVDDKAIAGGKGKFIYGTDVAQRMVEGELKDAKQYVGAAAVEGKTFVLTCVVESFEDPPRPEFIRACETLGLK